MMDARKNRLINTLEMRNRARVMKSRPYSIQLEVTTKCNFACIMCARDKYHGVGENLTDDILEPVIRELVPYCQDIIVSSFGEPLLYPELPRIFNEIDPESGLELGFFTNFVLMTEEMAELIINSGVAYVNASIDGATRESYEKIRRGGKWDILCEKLDMFNAVKKRLKSRTPRMNLCVVGSTLNVEEIPLFVEFAHRFGFDSVKYNHNMYVDDEKMDYMSLVHEKRKTNDYFRSGYQRALELGIHTNFDKPPFQDEGDATVPPPKRSEGVSPVQVMWNALRRKYHNKIGWRVENTWKHAGGNGGNFAKLFVIKGRDYILDRIPVVRSSFRRAPVPHPIPNDAPPRTCGNPWTHVHVKSDGLVYPCCFSDEVMGDLRKQPFEEIWNGEKYQDLRESLRTGKYWGSCRRASCNWVEGGNSSVYGATIEVLNAPQTIDGLAGTTLKVRLTNTGQFRWEDEKTNKTSFVSLSYRIFNKKLELIDEGLHIPIPQNMHPGHTVEMDLPIKRLAYAGDVTIKVDLVHEKITWFGERGNSAVELPVQITGVPFGAYLGTWNAAQTREVLDSRPLTPGEEFTLPIRLRNVGNNPLGEDIRVSYHWQAEAGDYEEIEGILTPLEQVLEPGQATDLSLPIKVPSQLKTGRYWLEIDVLRDQDEWISQIWHRRLLAYPVKVARSVEEAPSIAERQPNGKPYIWEPKGQCVSHTGNKGIW